MKCQFCSGKCIKKGKRNRRQAYQCKQCSKYQQRVYRNKSYSEEKRNFVVRMNNEGVSLRSISRLLSIPKSTVSRILLKEGSKLSKPNNFEKGEEYEVDELRTFIGSKDNECWICYAINRRTKQVIDYTVGRRTKKNLKKVIDTILLLNPRRIFTDKLNSYPSLIPQLLHSTKFRGTNYIERNNLTLRTHLKRLNKKTICFSKSIEMLNACLGLYFWFEGWLD